MNDHADLASVQPRSMPVADDVVAAAAALGSMPARFHIHTERPDASLTWSELLEPEVLRGVIAAQAAQRGIDDDQIAASLFVQGAAMHVLAGSLAAETIHGIALRAAPDELWLAPGYPTQQWGIDRRAASTSANGTADQPAAPTPASPEGWIEHWPAGHLTALVDAVHRVVKVGRRMLLGNVASATGSNLVFLDWWHPEADVTALAGVILGHPALRPHVSMSTVTVQGRTGLRTGRNSCCLLLRVDPTHACPSCPMVSDDERLASTAMHVGHLLAVKPLEV